MHRVQVPDRHILAVRVDDMRVLRLALAYILRHHIFGAPSNRQAPLHHLHDRSLAVYSGGQQRVLVTTDEGVTVAVEEDAFLEGIDRRPGALLAGAGSSAALHPTPLLPPGSASLPDTRICVQASFFFVKLLVGKAPLVGKPLLIGRPVLAGKVYAGQAMYRSLSQTSGILNGETADSKT
eukprot:CAMPEP_0174751750 /NCGR_PEP_ID=MMETSP1094-20130205/100503_1 /TAXON_ID=156173 /ORGANISM="Chrysochromulina brevifilum, Strain UTEX LB 985" /LENGTH=179 /DNA_ID=CAMNT_0015957287 /DNA_START=142 /DNA_END=679 /DNA_ORIENTATION=+